MNIPFVCNVFFSLYLFTKPMSINYAIPPV